MSTSWRRWKQCQWLRAAVVWEKWSSSSFVREDCIAHCRRWIARMEEWLSEVDGGGSSWRLNRLKAQDEGWGVVSGAGWGRNLQDISILIFFDFLCEGGFKFVLYDQSDYMPERQGVDLLRAPPWLEKMLDGCGTMGPGEYGRKKDKSKWARRIPSFGKWDKNGKI